VQEIELQLFSHEFTDVKVTFDLSNEMPPIHRFLVETLIFFPGTILEEEFRGRNAASMWLLVADMKKVVMLKEESLAGERVRYYPQMQVHNR